jgi:hypothetical protein
VHFLLPLTWAQPVEISSCHVANLLLLMTDVPYTINIENPDGIMKFTFVETSKLVVMKWRAVQELLSYKV